MKRSMPAAPGRGLADVGRVLGLVLEAVVLDEPDRATVELDDVTMGRRLVARDPRRVLLVDLLAAVAASGPGPPSEPGPDDTPHHS